jgi:acetylornithine deacetylase
MAPESHNTVGFLRSLVAINSVNPALAPGSPGEAQMAEAVADQLRRIGLDVIVTPVTPGRPNVVGVLEGRRKGRALMLCGHLDTVGIAGMLNPFDPVERDGRLYGRGSQDMKGGLAAIVGAAALLAGTGALASGRLVVAAVVDEEHESIGAEALVREWAADAAVVTEPTALQVVIGHKGFSWIEVQVHGKAAHGSRPAEGRDAILDMGRVLGDLESLNAGLLARPPHPLLGTGSLHASIIEGGHELSSYPNHARLQLERRTLPGEPPSAAIDEVQRILDAQRLRDPLFRAEAREVFSRPPYELPADHLLPQMLAEAVRHVGFATREAGASFWTDAAILAHAGIPSVLFGPGGAGLHSTEEYVEINDVIACRAALVELARRFC